MRDYNVEISSSDQANLTLMEKAVTQLSNLLVNIENTTDEKIAKFNGQLNQRFLTIEYYKL
jgi:hypothetical protein